MKQQLPKFCIVLLFILILTHPDISILGASRGLILWYQVIVPTLLPSMILSNLIVQTDAAFSFISLLQPLCKPLFRTSKEGTYALVMGVICGYPMGAKVVNDFVEKKMMTKQQGQYVLSFCNFPSPMFLIGYIATKTLHNTSFLLPILLSIYLSSMIISLISRHIYHIGTLQNDSSPRKQQRFRLQMLDYCLINCVEIMVKIGIYMMLFTLMSELIGYYLSSDNILACFSMGMLEMTTGIYQISLLPYSTMIICCMIVFFASFGGLSTTMQTYSVIKNSNLSILHYIGWKLIHGFLSSILCFLFLLL